MKHLLAPLLAAGLLFAAGPAIAQGANYNSSKSNTGNTVVAPKQPCLDAKGNPTGQFAPCPAGVLNLNSSRSNKNN